MSFLTRIADFFYAPADEPPAPEVASDPVEVEKAASPTKPVGASGQSYYGGYLSTNERNPEMVGAAKWKNFEDAKRNVAAIGLGMRVYLTLAGTPDWTIEPYKPDDATEPTPEDKEWAKWFEDSLHKMDTPWKTATQIAMLAAWDGFNMQTWHLRRDALGRFALADLFWLECPTIERWLTDERGKVTGVVQRSAQTMQEVEVPRDRIAWNRDLPLTGSPEGLGILRQLAESVRQLKLIEQALGKGFEKDANQTPVFYGPISERRAMIGKVDEVTGVVYTQADFDREFQGVIEYASAAKRRGAAVVLDSRPYVNEVDGTLSNVPKWRFEVVKASMESADAQAAEIKRLTWIALAMASLEFLLMGSDGVGSLAMSASKMENARRGITNALNAWAETFRREVIQPVWKWNGRDPDTAPTPTFEALELADMAAIVQSIAALATAAGIEPARMDPIVDRVLAVQGLPPLLAHDDAGLVLRREEARKEAAALHGLDEPEPDDEEDEES